MNPLEEILNAIQNQQTIGHVVGAKLKDGTELYLLIGREQILPLIREIASMAEKDLGSGIVYRRDPDPGIRVGQVESATTR